MDSHWFTHYSHVNNVKLRLYCFHYAGGSSNIFRSWQARVPDNVEVVSVELPGHGKRLNEQCAVDLMDLVQRIGAELGKKLDVPFGFFGQSMGALISFELTRLLRRFALPQPSHLILSAHKAPHLPRESEPLHVLPEPDFIKRLEELNGTPKEVLQNPELRALFLPLLRADFRVCETYRYQRSLPLDRPMTVLGGQDDKDVGRTSLQAWQEHTTGPFQLHICAGDHFFIHSAEDSLFSIINPLLMSIMNEK